MLYFLKIETGYCGEGTTELIDCGSREDADAWGHKSAYDNAQSFNHEDDNEYEDDSINDCIEYEVEPFEWEKHSVYLDDHAIRYIRDKYPELYVDE